MINLIKKILFTKISVSSSFGKSKLKKEIERIEEENRGIKEENRKLKDSFGEALEKVETQKKEFERAKKSLLNILEDITEREKIVKTQREILDNTINYFIHGIILFDKNKNIILANKKVFEIFRIKRNEDRQESHRMLKEDKNFDEILNFLKENSSYQKEVNFNRNYFKIDKVLFKGDKEIDCLIILNDITIDKEIQQAQSDFVALTAHQLRTPLSGIKWTLEMFLEGVFGEFNEEQKQYIKQLSDNTNRLIKVVSRFLDVARIRQGRLIEKKEILDIADITNEVIKSSESLLKEKKTDLEFDFARDVTTTINGDREQIKLVIQNLLENAIRYTKKEGIIKIVLKNSQGNLIFSIKDNGYGIPLEEQEKIFTKFFRTSNIKTVDTEGSGLGLFIVKNIVEAHNGNIWFESEGVNHGATFYFALSVASEKNSN